DSPGMECAQLLSPIVFRSPASNIGRVSQRDRSRHEVLRMKRSHGWILSIAVLVMFLGWAAALQPMGEVDLQKDLVYGNGGGIDLMLNLAMPKSGEGPFPAIVCIHGGAWKAGKRQDLDRTVETLAGRGYVAATVSYRLTSTAPFPAQIKDCKAAVRWLPANGPKYKINRDRIAAIGFSAGAHLACLLGTTDKQDGFEGSGGNPEESSRVQAVVSFFGPTDFTTKDWADEVEKSTLVPLIGASF